MIRRAIGRIGLLLLCAALALSTAFSAESFLTTRPLAPVGPSGLRAEAGDGQVTLTWEPSPGAVKYRVARCFNGAYVTRSSNIITEECTLGHLKNGVQYGFAVKAYDGSRWTNYSKPVYVTPAAGKSPEAVEAPAGLTAEAGDRQITLTWDPVPGATKYRICRYLNGVYTTLSSNNITGTYTAKRLRNGAQYGFVVKAYNGSVWSGYSEKVYAIPIAGAENPPVVVPAPAPAVDTEPVLDEA